MQRIWHRLEIQHHIDHSFEKRMLPICHRYISVKSSKSRKFRYFQWEEKDDFNVLSVLFVVVEILKPCFVSNMSKHVKYIYIVRNYF